MKSYVLYRHSAKRADRVRPALRAYLYGSRPSIASFGALLVLQGDVVRFLLRLRTSLITVYNDDYADPTRDPGYAPVRWFAGSLDSC